MANYKLLEPSLDTVTSGKVSFDTSAPSATSAIETTTFLMFTAIFLAGAGVLAYGGFQFVMTFSTTVKGEARETIKRAIFGILGVLGMWLFLMKVNPDMLKGDLLPSTIKQGTATTPNTITNNNPNSGGSTPSYMSDAITRGTLTRQGIIINKDDCTQTQWHEKNPSCTSVLYLGQSIIDTLIKLKNVDCKTCLVTITGGTEPGHKSHGLGSPIADLHCDTDPTGKHCGNIDKLSFFLKTPKGLTSCGATSNTCFTICTYDGFKFCDETIVGNPPHWHVSPQ